MTDLLTSVHRRWNPLRRSYVLVSPHRSQRPWQGEEEKGEPPKPEYDPKCYLCPGNKRVGGEQNPKYDSTFLFTNDFAAVKPLDGPEPQPLVGDLFKADAVEGTCQVICFSPKHNITIAHMKEAEILPVIDAWGKVYQEALEMPQVAYCQIFENKGSAMGCSNPHPHGQAWMTSVIPDEPQIEHEALKAYFEKNGTHMLEDYAREELSKVDRPGSRVIDYNDTFVSVVPFWATWPFETLLISRKRIRNILDLSKREKKDLADILHKLTVRYDNLFSTSFPYSMGIHQAFTKPCEDGADVEHFLFHFYPPLLRSASVRKFLVGYEMLGMPQRDITPELAAEMLRKQSLVHYSHN